MQWVVLIAFVYLRAAHAEPTSGLVGGWKLDETSGTTAAPFAGAISGTLTGFQASPWVTGKINNAASLNNTNGTRIELGNNFGFAGLDPFTIAAWYYKINNDGGSFPIVASKSFTDANGQQGWSFGTCNSCGTANRGFACSRYLDGANQVAIDMTGDVPVGQWVHAVCTYDGSRIRIYRDGVLVNTGASMSRSMISHSAVAKIGNGFSNTGAGRANIDDVRIYDRALAADEIYTLANPCTASEAGTLEYMSDNRLRYCNGSYWESTTSRSAGAACSNPGEYDYDTTNNYMRFCNGTNYYPMGPVGAGGSGCSSPTAPKGSLQYNSTTKYYTYCDGTSWVNVGS